MKRGGPEGRVRPRRDEGAANSPPARRSERRDAARPPAARSSLWWRVALVVVPLAAVAVYLDALRGGFVWDDRFLVLDNPRVHSLRYLGDLFLKDYVFVAKTNLAYGYYRPLAAVSLLVDSLLWGERPLGFHLTNVLLHAGSSFLVLLLARRLGLGRGASFACALLFAVHPIHVESVAWIAGRTDVLSFLLAAASLFVALGPAGAPGAAADRSPRRVAASVALFALALLAKEMAAVVPLWIAWLEWRRPARDWRAALRATAPYLAVLGLYLVLRFAVLDIAAPGSPPGTGRAAALLSAPWTLLRYLAWLAVPLHASAYVQNPYVRGLADWRLAVPLAILALLGVAVARLGRRYPAAPLFAGLLVLAFAPILNVAGRIAGPADMGDPMAERFAYFASFPFLALATVAAGAALDRMPSLRARRVAASSLLAVFVLFGAARVLARTPDWRDDATLFAVEARRTPGAALVWANLAQARLRAGDLAGADAAIRRAETLEPNGSGVLSARAEWWIERGDYQAALALERALAASRNGATPATENNLAFLYRMTGHPEDAKPLLEDLTRRLPEYADPHFNLAEIARAAKDVPLAERELRIYLALRPGDPRAVDALASFAAAGGRPAEAEAIYRAALRGTASDAKLWNNLALLRRGARDRAGAIDALERAVAADPSYERARFNLASVLVEVGRVAEGRAGLERLASGATDSAIADAARRRLAEIDSSPRDSAARDPGENRPR